MPKRQDGVPAPPPKRVRIDPTSELPMINSVSLQGQSGLNDQDQAFVAVNGSNNGYIGSSTGPSGSMFEMTTMLDQPLVFDFNTSPYNETRLPVERASSAPVRPANESSPRDLGHGTLVMSKSGASSKYYGHTAASEWLQDVRCGRVSHETDIVARDQ